MLKFTFTHIAQDQSYLCDDFGVISTFFSELTVTILFISPFFLLLIAHWLGVMQLVGHLDRLGRY
jgi:hypothetical protein